MWPHIAICPNLVVCIQEIVKLINFPEIYKKKAVNFISFHFIEYYSNNPMELMMFWSLDETKNEHEQVKEKKNCPFKEMKKNY